MLCLCSCVVRACDFVLCVVCSVLRVVLRFFCVCEWFVFVIVYLLVFGVVFVFVFLVVCVVVVVHVRFVCCVYPHVMCVVFVLRTCDCVVF